MRFFRDNFLLLTLCVMVGIATLDSKIVLAGGDPSIKDNKVKNSDEMAVFGSKNDISGSTIHSLVAGYNNQENNGDYNATFGTLNNVKNSKATKQTRPSLKFTRVSC